MTWIDILWPMMGAASLTLGLIHLLIWFRQRTQFAPLMFSVAAASIAIVSILELLLMRAQTPAEYAALLRWIHVPVAMIVFALVNFVLLHFRAGRPRLALAVCTLRGLALFPDFLSGVNLNFQTITALTRSEVWGNDAIAIPIGSPNPWMLLGQLSNFLLVVFLLDAIVTVWRRGDVEQGRRALLACGSMALFVMLASAWTVLVVTGLVRGPLTINVAFFIVLLVMSYELGGDVLRATRLAQQLSSSEANLRESEERIQLAARAAGLGFWTWDFESNQSWFSETGSILVGLGPGEHFDRETLLAKVHPDDRDAIARAREEAINRSGEYACEFRLLLPGNNISWIAAQGRVEYTAAGKPTVMRGVILDITERKQAAERFRLVVDGSPIAMLMLDGEGRILLANVEAERVFGYIGTGLLHRNIKDLIPDYLLAGQADQVGHEPDLLNHPPGLGRELRACRRDGTDVPIEIGVNRIRDGENNFVLVIVADISERLQLEQDAMVHRYELAHLSRVALLGELSGSLAHELNQPLTAVLSNAQAGLRFLERDAPDLAEVHDSLLHIIENEKRASEVIRRLRAMLRKEHVSHKQLSINEIVRETLRLVHSDILNRNVSLTLALSPDLPLVAGDRVQLQQVLLNLVINACDAMSEMLEERSLIVRTQFSRGIGVEVAISDVGEGIPVDDLERIFTPFVTSKAQGIGLGLSICRTIVQAHHGRLWATKNAGPGATLHFVLPVDQGVADG